MIEKILHMVFPISCGICGKMYKKPICPKCLKLIKSELKYYTIKQEKNNVYFISFYEGIIKNAILRFKFKDKPYLYDFFVEIIIRNTKIKNIINKYDYIVPVPMHKDNKKIRGYNQTELITKKIEKETGIKYLKCLEKIKHNKQQSLLNEKERTKNVQKVYRIINKETINNKKILLIDDIYTTGSTANECIKELRKGKPKKVDILVICKSKKG